MRGVSSDGEAHNLSWNCGEEGPTRKVSVAGLRARQARNLAAALLLARGVPMVLMGDEYLHTKARPVFQLPNSRNIANQGRLGALGDTHIRVDNKQPSPCNLEDF